MRILAQLASDVTGPSIGLGSLGITVFMLRWFMNTITPQLKAIERSLDHNTRAALLLAIAHDEASSAVKAKLNACLDELNQKEALSKRKHDGEDL